jgi:hypothetical protein
MIKWQQSLTILCTSLFAHGVETAARAEDAATPKNEEKKYSSNDADGNEPGGQLAVKVCVAELKRRARVVSDAYVLIAKVLERVPGV